MVGLGFQERKYLILVVLASLIFISFGWFDRIFSFSFLDFISLRTVVGFAGVWVWAQFYLHRT